MKVRQFKSQKLISTTYKLTTGRPNKVWLVDLGNWDPVFNSLSEDEHVEGLFITHGHYDHIYGINQLIEIFPSCKIYASAYTMEALYDPKLNLSFYRGNPFIYTGEKPIILNDGDEIALFDDIKVKVIATPGHNPGCLTYEVGNYLFTGDSYIPNMDVVTKLKHGKKIESLQSLRKIQRLIGSDTLICPGHGPTVAAKQILPHIASLK